MSDFTNKLYTGICTVILFFLSLFVAFLIGEIFIRTFYPQRLFLNVSQWDPYVGFSHIPNIEGFSMHKDFIMHIKINSRGLRDREFSYHRPKKTIRIGVFGDSFTFGEGVQNDESYPKLLERLINRDDSVIATGGNVEVLNFGIGNTGTSHQLAWYRKEGRKYKLDYVILGFLSINDFKNNWVGVFYLKDGQLIHNPVAYSSIRKIQAVVYKIPFYQWLAANSHLVNLARTSASILEHRMRRKRSANWKMGNDASKSKSEISEDEYRLTLRLIEEFRKEVQEDDAQFILINLAAKRQKPLDDYREKKEIKPYMINDERLLQELRKKGVRVVDLRPTFAKLPVSEYYFENDGHLNRHGLEVVAERVYKSIFPDVRQSLQLATDE